ncbi:MAG: GntR family transcriptional regulator [Acidimicrobiales bacterium]
MSSPASTVTRLISAGGGNGLAESVAQQLADAIHLGLLAPGEHLPSESALAAQLGISTVTLRDALASLRTQGLVETRRGRHGGTFVCGPAAASTARLRARLRELSVVELRDLGDECTAVAGASARLAARRAGADEVAVLRRFADALGRARSIGDRARANSRFSIELALAARSERLTRAELRLQAEAGELLWLPTAAPLDHKAVACDLRAVADAVAAEDAERARSLVERRTERNMRWLVAAHMELVDG